MVNVCEDNGELVAEAADPVQHESHDVSHYNTHVFEDREASLWSPKDETALQQLSIHFPEDETTAPKVISNHVQIKSVTENKSTVADCNCRFKKECISLILDSGASRHITGSLNLLNSVHKGPNVSIETACGHKAKSDLYGDLRVILENNIVVTWKDVIYCKQIKNNILSVRQMAKNGFSVHIKKNEAKMEKDGKTFYSAKFSENLGSYILHCSTKFSHKQGISLYQVSSTEDLDILHHRLAHASPDYLCFAGQTPMKSPPFCAACAQGKLIAKPKKKYVSSSTSQYIAKWCLEKLHMDTMGPFNFCRGYYQDRFVLTVADDYSRFIWAFPLPNKHVIPKTVIKLAKRLMNFYEQKIKVINSDNGAEFVNSSLDNFCSTVGIEREFSNVCFPSENGIVVVRYVAYSC